MRKIAIAALSLSLGLTQSIVPAFAQKKPVKGVDIIVKKDPGATARRVVTNGEGRFRVVAKEAGSYSITANGRLMTRVEAKAGAVISGVIKAEVGERGVSNKGTKGCDICIIEMD